MANWGAPRTVGPATAALLLLLGGCQDLASSDGTPPALTLDTFGSFRPVRLDAAATADATVRARSDDTVRIKVVATDRESGIRRLTMSGNLDSVCIPASGTKLVTVREPVGQVVPTSSAAPEGVLTHAYLVDVAARRAACPPATRFYELTGTVVAAAENGRGHTTTLRPLHVRAFGSDFTVIGAFNLYQPGHHPDEVYTRWGRELASQADVVMLSEVPDLRRAKLLADAAGLPHVVMHADVAVASRGPIRNVRRETVDPPGSLASNDSHLLSVVTDVGGYPHQVIAMHWGIRDANDVSRPPGVGAFGRQEAAQRALALLDADTPVAFAGGDLNAYGGAGPQLQPNVSTPEIDRLRSVFTDPYVELKLPDSAHCSNQRIDYVMYRGPVAPFRYQACFREALPSDHPFVLVTFTPR